MLSSITPTRPYAPHPARDASPVASPSLASSAALALQAGARLASAVSVSVGAGLAGKAGYMALARAMPHASHRPLSLALVGAGAVPAWAGAGVVADSVPAAEYQETLNKAAALFKAVAMAEQF